MPFVEIHSHILPNLDDGAKDEETSFKMLKSLSEQGAECVFATPHFDFRRISVDDFEIKRQAALDKLNARIAIEDRNDLCPVLLGAEVLYSAHIGSFVDLSRLTLGDKPYVLIEFASKITDKIVDDITHIINSSDFGLIFAHTERYVGFGFHRQLKKLSKLDIKFQVNYDSFVFNSPYKKAANYLMEEGYIDFLATDAHNLSSRSPDFRKELEILYKEFGAKKIDGILSHSIDFFNF